MLIIPCVRMNKSRKFEPTVLYCIPMHHVPSTSKLVDFVTEAILQNPMTRILVNLLSFYLPGLLCFNLTGDICRFI
jgi:hypothetical protein